MDSTTFLAGPSSLSEISHTWLLATAAGVLLFSLFEAWLATLIVYGKVAFLKRLFPVPHNLVRSHVDYLIMTTLLVISYFLCQHLAIELPKWLILVLCGGVIYNPFGFFIKAIKPNAGNAETPFGRVLVCLGFLPTTIGFGYVMGAVLLKLAGF
ncbi:MAG: hypothetical protein IPM37_22015 [Hahellaceae bacterium]|nr:hypothetical protein [Hahellaceae bacterium]